MFKANKSLFKPKGYTPGAPTGSEKENSSGMENKAPEGEVKADHPFHKGGEGFHSLKHEESGHTHSISHHEDGIHHTISHPDHGEHHMLHNGGGNSQLVQHEESPSADPLASSMPRIS